MNLRKLILLLALFLATGVGAQIQQQSPYPKREFRGAWIQAVNGQFRGIPTEKLKQTLIDQLNSLQGQASMRLYSRCVRRQMLYMLHNWNRGAVF